MKIQPKRWRRRQQSLERAYWHVREVMMHLGRPVRDVLVPTWLPEDCPMVAESIALNNSTLGQCEMSTNHIWVRAHFVSEVMEDTLYHECVHANQPIRDESHIPYWDRPIEIEAREIASISMKLRRLPRSEW